MRARELLKLRNTGHPGALFIVDSSALWLRGGLRPCSSP
jgi:hypothetical protein